MKQNKTKQLPSLANESLSDPDPFFDSNKSSRCALWRKMKDRLRQEKLIMREQISAYDEEVVIGGGLDIEEPIVPKDDQDEHATTNYVNYNSYDTSINGSNNSNGVGTQIDHHSSAGRIHQHGSSISASINIQNSASNKSGDVQHSGSINDKDNLQDSIDNSNL